MYLGLYSHVYPGDNPVSSYILCIVRKGCRGNMRADLANVCRTTLAQMYSSSFVYYSENFDAIATFKVHYMCLPLILFT